MDVDSHETAWDHPATRKTWLLHTALIPTRLLSWLLVWIVVLAASVSIVPPGWSAFAVPFLAYSFFRAFIQIFYFPSALRIRRILRQYPWQFLADVPRGLSRHPEAHADRMWFEFDDPSSEGNKIPMLFLTQIRTYWWQKRIGGPRTKQELKRQIQPLWFAGDPRFVAVVAAPGREGSTPKRMHVLYQRPCLGRNIGSFKWTGNPADVDRARRAGARVPEPAHATLN